MASVNPYLSFNGNCEEAFNFYKSVFGGEFRSLMRYKEAPSEHQSEGEDEKLVHISLPIGQGTVLMGSDRPGSMGPTTRSDDFQITVNGSGEDEANKIFNGLSEGGQITVPLHKSYWGSYFGMITDKFGVHWIINYSYNQQP